MIGVVIATHGEFGNSLLATLKMVLGEVEGMVSVALASEDSLETFQTKLEKALRTADPQGEGALILVDMLGGTPFNVALRLAQAGKAQVLTGVSLPMLIKASSHREDKDLQAVVLEVQKAARESVVTSLELFKK